MVTITKKFMLVAILIGAGFAGVILVMYYNLLLVDLVLVQEEHLTICSAINVPSVISLIYRLEETTEGFKEDKNQTAGAFKCYRNGPKIFFSVVQKNANQLVLQFVTRTPSALSECKQTLMAALKRNVQEKCRAHNH